MSSNGEGSSTRIDFVIGLTKKQLLAEVFHQDAAIQSLKNEVDAVLLEKDKLLDLYSNLVERNETRLDKLSDEQKAIVDQRLGLNQPVRVAGEGEKKQVSRRRFNWKDTRSKFENDRKEEYWKHYSEANAAALNDPRVAPAPKAAPIEGQPVEVNEDQQDSEEIA